MDKPLLFVLKSVNTAKFVNIRDMTRIFSNKINIITVKIILFTNIKKKS